jgi:hypothetical protein
MKYKNGYKKLKGLGSSEIGKWLKRYKLLRTARYKLTQKD